jgi:miniconductance mechanosensitive channel
MFESVDKWLTDFFELSGVSPYWHDMFVSFLKLLIIILISYLFFKITHRLLLTFLRRIAAKTETRWDDVLVEQKVFNRLAYLVPAYILHLTVPLALAPYPDLITAIQLGIKIYSTIIVMLIFSAFFNSVLLIYQQYPVSKTRPIKGYIQVAKIILYLLVSITVISFLLGQNPLLMIGGLGAFSAVLLLVFKDSILGLVAGVQLTVNDMLRPGDWISLPKYDADGTVIDITLTTVKVQNWDRTFTTVPAYALFAESFKNFRGMEESGGRRIKRSINIDMNSVKFCTPDMLQKFERIHYVAQYIKDKEVEIKKFNEAQNIDPHVLVNGRRQTNLGVFRNYLKNYLLNHPKIHNDMTFLIRHLQPTETGIPIEVYVFSREQAWAVYEAIQADIFDHILAVIPEFELRVFQNPSGADFKSLVKANAS